MNMSKSKKYHKLKYEDATSACGRGTTDAKLMVEQRVERWRGGAVVLATYTLYTPRGGTLLRPNVGLSSD